jgi:hypothetical protein
VLLLSEGFSLVTELLINISIEDVMNSVLPEELHDEIPTGFNTAGHVGTLKILHLAHFGVVSNGLQRI